MLYCFRPKKIIIGLLFTALYIYNVRVIVEISFFFGPWHREELYMTMYALCIWNILNEVAANKNSTVGSVQKNSFQRSFTEYFGAQEVR